MNNDFICPFCNHAVALAANTHRCSYHDFHNDYRDYRSPDTYPYLIELNYYKCPHCNEESIVVLGLGDNIPKVTHWINPISVAKQYPDYIPEQIRNDYSEASSIIELSPKASATLARRCLQGMIRDFWGVSGKDNLFQEINAIQGDVSPATWNALTAIRQIGNIGAHMEQDINKIIDVEPSEAKTLLKLIEHLMDEWYIKRHDTETLLENVKKINDTKQAIIRGEQD